MPSLVSLLARPRAAALAAAALAAAAVAVPGAPSPASAASTATAPLGQWSLDEPAGARVARDSSGNGFDGTVGTAVRAGVAGYDGTAFHFTPPSGEVHDAQRLVTVPDEAGLDPGSRDLHVSLRVRSTDADDFNVMQKGQAATAGGFWKVQLDDGHPSCVFLGVTSGGARVSAGLSWPSRVNDGSWHRIQCDKLASSIRMSVDGATPLVNAKAVGRIDNTWALVMGGKVSCNPAGGVDCDYYHGDIDSVVLTTG